MPFEYTVCEFQRENGDGGRWVRRGGFMSRVDALQMLNTLVLGRVGSGYIANYRVYHGRDIIGWFGPFGDPEGLTEDDLNNIPDFVDFD